jgi:hypothetical protein
MKIFNFFKGRLARKGDMPFIIVMIALAVLVMGIFAVIFARNASNVDKTLEGGDCPGTCKNSCTFGEIRVSKTCTVSGEKVLGVCCATPMDLIKKDNKTTPVNGTINTTGTGGTGGTSDTRAVIEVRLDDDVLTKIMDGSTNTLKAGNSYIFSVWGAGTNAQNCEIKFLKDGKTPTAGFLSGMNKGPELCVDDAIKDESFQNNRKNIMIQAFQPLEADVGTYQMQVFLYDKDNKIVASARFIGIQVVPAVPPLTP